MILLMLVYLLTGISQYYTALMHTVKAQFANMMQSYSSKKLTLSNVCNLIFIKICLVSQSKGTALG